jgi:hypothetical protein
MNVLLMMVTALAIASLACATLVPAEDVPATVAAALAATQTAAPTTTPEPSPTSTPSPTPSATPTPTITPTPTAASDLSLLELPPAEAVATASHSWRQVVFDRFTVAETDRWSTGRLETAFGTASTFILAGKLRCEAATEDGANFRIYASDVVSAERFYLAVEGQHVRGGSGMYGLVFHAVDDNNLYLFATDGREHFTVVRLDDGAWRRLIPWKVDDAIRADQVNKLAVLAEGSYVRFFINEVFVGEVESLLDGLDVGLAVDLDPEAEAVFEFDNFELRAP